MQDSASEKILSAAREVFTQKGYAAARMQEIADTAGINKALLHYYFRTKDRLFEEIFAEAFTRFVDRINKVLESNDSLFDKIDSFVNQYVDIMIEYPQLPSFVIHEVNRDPERFLQNLHSKGKIPRPGKFLKQLEQGSKSGVIRPVIPLHFLVHMISLCIFPFIGKPMFQGILQISPKDYNKFLEERKKEVSTFLIESLKVK